jgi:TrmH family RNA methyltransferase
LAILIGLDAKINYYPLMLRAGKLSKSRSRYLHRLKLKKYRQQENAFLIEGKRLVETALTSDWTVEEVYLSQRALGSMEDSTLGQAIAARDIPALSASAREIDSLCETETPQGIAALVRARDYNPDQFEWERLRLCLVLEDLKDPGNLGMIIRTAHGFGVDVIFLTRGCVELFSPKVVRATMGSLFYVPVLVEGSISAVDFVKRLADRGFEVIAGDPEGEIEIGQKNFPEMVCMIIGSEPTGISKGLRGLAEVSARIPTRGSLESLNVAAACSIFLYEIARQKRF